MASIFSAVPLAPRDPILGLTEAFNADPNPAKVNLGVGVYQDATGKLPLLECVRLAEQRLAENPKPTEAEVRDYLEGNICRCTGYHNIVKAVLAASGQDVSAVAAE